MATIKVDSNPRGISTNVTEGVTERFRTYFIRYPNSRPRHACLELHLDPRRYGATARVVKSRVRKMWDDANIQADSLEALSSVHRQLWYLQGGVPSGPVLSAFVDLARSGSNRNNTWYRSRNQNGQLNYRSTSIAIRILPTTRRLEVLCRIPGMPGADVCKEVEKILYGWLNGHLPADHDAAWVARDLSSKLVPKEKHRRFEFPPGPSYMLRYYEDTLGVVIQRDLSEGVNELEVIEKTPPWIQILISVVITLSECLREVMREIHQFNELQREVSKTLTLMRENVSANGSPLHSTSNDTVP